MHEVFRTLNGSLPRGKPVVLAGAGLLCASTAFPVVASVLREDQVGPLMGVLDVVLAFVAVATGWLIVATAGTLDERVIRTSCRVYRVAGNVLLVLLITFFLVGDRIRWNILLPGLAWRGWLLMYALPAGVSAWQSARTETRDIR